MPRYIFWPSHLQKVSEPNFILGFKLAEDSVCIVSLASKSKNNMSNAAIGECLVENNDNKRYSERSKLIVLMDTSGRIPIEV